MWGGQILEGHWGSPANSLAPGFMRDPVLWGGGWVRQKQLANEVESTMGETAGLWSAHAREELAIRDLFTLAFSALVRPRHSLHSDSEALPDLALPSHSV